MTVIYSPPNHKEGKKLSLLRIKEAKILFKNSAYNGAYYLAGYSIEFALKACYCKTVTAQSFPPVKGIYNKLYDHNLNSLMDVSNVKKDFEKDAQENTTLQINWEIVKDWSVGSRYSSNIKRKEAEAMISSVQNRSNGILTWIKKVW